MLVLIRRDQQEKIATYIGGYTRMYNIWLENSYAWHTSWTCRAD